MSLQRSWVEEIHKRLTVRYGKAFPAQWKGIAHEDVVSDWADTLDGVTARMVKHALGVLPEKAMNASQFRWMCLQAPAEREHEAIAYTPAPQTPEQRAVLGIAAAALAAKPLSPGQYCLDRLRTWEARNGERLNQAQREQLAALERQYGKPAETAQEAQT
jgi:hypothetical protein